MLKSNNYHFRMNYNLNLPQQSNVNKNSSIPQNIPIQNNIQSQQRLDKMAALLVNADFSEQNPAIGNINRKNEFLYFGVNNNSIGRNNGNNPLNNILRNQDKVKDANENSFKKTLRNNITLRENSPKINKKSCHSNLNQQNIKIDSLMSSYNNSELVNQTKQNYKFLPHTSLNNKLSRGNSVSNINNSNYQKVLSEEIHTQENYDEEIAMKEKFFYSNTTTSVKDYCYFEDQNSKYRQYMEDYCKIIDKFTGDKNKGSFNLFDGHGGTEISKYCKDRYSELFQSFYELHPTNIEKAISLSFAKLDEEIKFLDSENKGSTACCLFINNDLNFKKRYIYSANIGDTRSLLISTNGYKRLSEDHRCSNLKEVQRVKNGGGVVFDERVYGQLMITRAFGDFGLKSLGVSSVPYINKHIINEDNDKYIIVASDGVWDVLEDDQVYNISKKTGNTEEFCKNIVTTAINNGSKDNISCIVIKLN